MKRVLLALSIAAAVLLGLFLPVGIFALQDLDALREEEAGVQQVDLQMGDGLLQRGAPGLDLRQLHLATFHSRPGLKRRVLRWGSAALCAFICASTLLIRQHSLADLLSGCALAAAMHGLVHIFYDKRRAST